MLKCEPNLNLTFFHPHLPEQLFQSQLQEQETKKTTDVANAQEMHTTLQKQMETHREQHQKQLADLRREITEKQTRIEALTE